jgi:hypothetical protein
MRKTLLLTATLLALTTPPAFARPIHDPPARAGALSMDATARPDWAPLGVAGATAGLIGAAGLASLLIVRRTRPRTAA